MNEEYAARVRFTTDDARVKFEEYDEIYPPEGDELDETYPPEGEQERATIVRLLTSIANAARETNEALRELSRRRDDEREFDFD